MLSDRLRDYGCEKIFSEKFSGKAGFKREKLEAAMDYVREDDVFVVTKLDRLARSVRDLANLAKRLEDKGVGLVVLDQNIDTTTAAGAAGRLLFTMIGAIGEFERDLINSRTSEGRDRAMANGVRFGRKSALSNLSQNKINTLIREFDAGEISKEDLALKYKMSRATIYRAVAQAKKDLGFNPDQLDPIDYIDGSAQEAENETTKKVC